MTKNQTATRRVRKRTGRRLRRRSRAARCPPSCCARWTPTGGRRTTCRSGRSICSTTRCSSEPLKREHIKPRLLGHWGTTPGLNFIYVHLNRVIKEHDLNMIYVTGPGHGGPALVANAYLEGTYSEVYPNISQDEDGMKRLFKQFCFPGGIPSHVAPETPGSIHEGGELGYALSHAYGAAFDNPDLIVACVVGDGEAETGPLATELALQQVPQPGARRLRAADPAPERLQDRQPLLPGAHSAGRAAEAVRGLRLQALLRRRRRAGARCTSRWPPRSTRRSPRSSRSRRDARTNGFQGRPAWPMIVLRTPKGWTGPPEIDGKKCEDYWRSHQVPMGDMDKPEHVRILEQWMKSYRPEELFDANGRLMPELAELAPKGAAAHERQPARQRRAAAARTCGCPTSATTPSTCRARAPSRPRRRACRASSCAT